MLATKRTFISLICITLLAGGCRSSTQTPDVGRLIISSDTTGADIYLNDRRQPLKTNGSIDLKPGAYEIKLSKNDSGSGEPLIGEAKANVKAGQSTRVVVGLSKMEIVRASATESVRAKTPAQKVILDYYAALQAKEKNKAFAYLNYKGRASQGGLSRFSRAVDQLSSIRVTGLRTESSDPIAFIEINRVGLETIKVPNKDSSAPAELTEVLITTVDELKGKGLLKIESIVDASGP